MSVMDIINILQYFLIVIGIISVALYFMMPLYTVVGFFMTKKFPKTNVKHKYAIMIAARNEETVIGNLIESINAQDYPSELVTVFVVADNCNDRTAEVARNHGAVCYERNDSEHCTKGYALEFLVDNINKDYGIESFEAYFIFDADNLLKKDYISRMNEAFDSGEKIVTSYRNTKNLGDNWIAASYALHWFRTVRQEHRGRSALGLATRIQGTGFMFASEIIKNGWHYVSFTEDRAFAADAVVNGYRISYCNDAEFYDEQPTSLRIAFRQRIRWSKGHLQAFAESGPKLFGHIFVSKKNNPEYKVAAPNKMPLTDSTALDIFYDVLKSFRYIFLPSSKTVLGILSIIPKLLLFPFSVFGFLVAGFMLIISKLIDKLFVPCKSSPAMIRFLNSRFMLGFKRRLMSFDMFAITFPFNLLTLAIQIINPVLDLLIIYMMGTFFSQWLPTLGAFALSVGIGYVSTFALGAYVFFMERKHMIKISVWKKVFYCFMWPLFDTIGSITMIIALFKKVEWKPIPHNNDINIDTLSKELAGKK